MNANQISELAAAHRGLTGVLTQLWEDRRAGQQIASVCTMLDFEFHLRQFAAVLQTATAEQSPPNSQPSSHA